MDEAKLEKWVGGRSEYPKLYIYYLGRNMTQLPAFEYDSECSLFTSTTQILQNDKTFAAKLEQVLTPPVGGRSKFINPYIYNYIKGQRLNALKRLVLIYS